MTKAIAEILDELLSTPEGADRLWKLIRLMPPSNHETQEMVPLCKVVWNASHRVSSVVDSDAIKPVSLNKITIAGRELYFVHDGNHRCEARSIAGKSEIPAYVCLLEARPVEVRRGLIFEFAIYHGEGRRDWRNERRIERDEVELLEKLGLLKMEVEKEIAPAVQKTSFWKW